jgi:putative colanic acid biosynthesis acetyltransferase WcaF
VNAPTAPEKFENPYSTGSKIGRMLWSIAWVLFFRPTPKRRGQGWRRLLLKIFGAKLGKCWLHPSVRIWAPWELEIGDNVYIDEGVWIYNAYGCTIHDRVIISADAILCTATHDYTHPLYPLTGAKIVVGADTWITMKAFVMPGVQIGAGAVIGAQSVVIKDVEPWTVVAGNPAKFIKTRIMKGNA